jgi:hypothetical protein
LLYTDADLRARFLATAASAADSHDVHENFVRFLSILSFGAFEGGGSLNRETCREMLAHHDLLSAAWNAATARPLQPRHTGSLREFRAKAIKLGVPASAFLLPAWFRRLEETFFRKIEQQAPESGAVQTEE